MAKKVFMADISGVRVRYTEVKLDGWCEGIPGQQRTMEAAQNMGTSRDTAIYSAQTIRRSGEPWCICS